MMPAETARDTVAALGQVGLLQFKDLCEDKSPLQRTFANQVSSFYPIGLLSGEALQTVFDASCIASLQYLVGLYSTHQIFAAT